MAQLHHIIGAILRDIAQSRVTSDLFSREISRYYEQDSLMRMFPIPRSEIREMTVDLKFAVINVSLDETRTEDREARLSGIFERLVETVTNLLYARLYNTATEQVSWVSFVALLDTTGKKQELNSELVTFFSSNRVSLIEEKQTDTGTTFSIHRSIASAGITRTLDRLVYSRAELGTVENGSKIMETVRGYMSRQMRKLLTDLVNDVEQIEDSEYMVEVEVTSDKLQQIPPENISTIHLSTATRNYIWSQVDEKDGQTIRRIIPE